MSLRKDSRKISAAGIIAPMLVSLYLILILAGNALAGPVTYDFSSLGTATGGFKPQGNRFLVSDMMVNDTGPYGDPSVIYYDDEFAGSANIIIKADNVNLLSFDLMDMAFTAADVVTITTMTITGTVRTGGTVTQLVTNQTLSIGPTYSLVNGLGADFSAFKDITHLTFDIVAGNLYYLNFATITIADNPPLLTSVHIISSNATPTLVKTNDVVTLSITALESITAPTVTIAGAAADVSGSGTSWTATYTMGAGDPEGPVTFLISGYTDTTGNTGVPVSAVTDTSSVTFDRTNPKIDSALYFDSTHVDVTFSEGVSGATSITNYSANNGLTVSTAVLQIGNTYRLTTSYLYTGVTYTITAAPNITDTAGNTLSSINNAASVKNPSSSDGDLNGSGTVDDTDASMAMRIATGLDDPPTDIQHGDVAPLTGTGGVPDPDGNIDIGDVVMILRKAKGLANW